MIQDDNDGGVRQEEEEDGKEEKEDGKEISLLDRWSICSLYNLYLPPYLPPCFVQLFIHLHNPPPRMTLLDKHVSLGSQAYIVAVIACSITFEAWASAALSPFQVCME